jgi:hypothetical protein
MDRNLKNRGKEIKYLNKDFTAFKQNLVEFTKTYFPKTYSDFSEASPGMMFIELASYIGDVMGYYIDDTLKESMMPYAEDINSVYALAQNLGYTPKTTSPSFVTLDVYQLVPAKGIASTNQPNEKYYLRIKDGMEVLSTQNDIKFITTDEVDFSDPNNRDIAVYQRDAITNEPTFYLIKKKISAISAQVVTETFSFGTYEPYRSIDLLEDNIIQIYDVRDGDGNKWYEVPYLAQEMVFIQQPNTESNDPDLYQFKDTVPYILKTIKTSRRFTVRVNTNGTKTLQFGAGDPTASDETLIPNLKNVGLGLPNSISRLEESFDPTNFLKTKTYGSSPANTTLTVKYWIGGGVNSNVAKNTIISLGQFVIQNDTSTFTNEEKGVFNSIRNSLAVDNDSPAVGGRGPELIEEIRENALAYFSAQNRVVTANDYQVRALSMPTKFGSVAKAFAIADGKLDNNSPSSILASPNALQEFTDLVMSFVRKPDTEEPTEATVKNDIRRFLVGKTSNQNEINNPFAINLYLLGYDSNGHLTPLTRGVKENLKTYLNEYRILTDGVNFSDGFVINIGLDFEIKVFPNYNKGEVLVNCMNELKNYFLIDKWTFNNTINISEVELLIASVNGVSSVSKVEFKNKCGGAYSPNAYNIEAATKDKIIYPSLDPSVFEIKFPNTDIKGRVL